MHQTAVARAKDWFTERLNGEDGLGGIFPAMVNAYQAMLLLGMPADHEQVVLRVKQSTNYSSSVTMRPIVNRAYLLFGILA